MTGARPPRHPKARRRTTGQVGEPVAQAHRAGLVEALKAQHAFDQDADGPELQIADLRPGGCQAVADGVQGRGEVMGREPQNMAGLGIGKVCD
jgi:hypothetical protein